MMSAGLSDWLATSLMIMGFAILLVLASYLLFTLIAGDGGRAPEDDLDLRTPSESFNDARLEGKIWPLAS